MATGMTTRRAADVMPVVAAGMLAAVLAMAAQGGGAPPTALLEPVATADLTDKQSRVLERIRKSPGTVGEVQLSRLRADVLHADAGPLSVPLPNAAAFDIPAGAVKRAAPGDNYRL